MDGLDCPWELALPPDRFDEWSSKFRQMQLSRLETAREHDRKAIAAIEKMVVLSERG
jgi:hypothetical protein